MSFSANKDLIERTGRPKSFDQYEIERLQKYLAEKKRKEEILESPFESLYEDLINGKILFDFWNALGEDVHRSISFDAEACINLSYPSKDVSLSDFRNWLSSFLKTYEHLILNYIQECLNDTLEEKYRVGEEKSMYLHLEEKDDENERVVGSIFKELYNFRNKLEHRIIYDKKLNKKVIKRPNIKHIKNLGFDLIKDVLGRLLIIYKRHFTHCDLSAAY